MILEDDNIILTLAFKNTSVTIEQMKWFEQLRSQKQMAKKLLDDIMELIWSRKERGQLEVKSWESVQRGGSESPSPEFQEFVRLLEASVQKIEQTKKIETKSSEAMQFMEGEGLHRQDCSQMQTNQLTKEPHDRRSKLEVSPIFLPLFLQHVQSLLQQQLLQNHPSVVANNTHQQLSENGAFSSKMFRAFMGSNEKQRVKKVVMDALRKVIHCKDYWDSYVNKYQHLKDEVRTELDKISLMLREISK